ncbi:unnamed protein product [Prorocentrum cordatum]|uniref:Uncharacterized protein n=1 Tax=Prorocentrum cordatum TaxID=2364126 RepID=A0ABN9U996_9DINO|nr:unnamed protein product [Polarella glacialis]
MTLAAPAALPAAVFPAAARGGQAVTELVEGVGGAANQVLASGPIVIGSTALFVGAITDDTLTLGRTAWKGHDLLNVTVVTRSGRLSLDAQEDIPALLSSEAGSQILQLQFE